MTDNNEFSGGLVVVPQSHKHFEELPSMARISRGRINYLRIGKNHPLLKRLQPQFIQCKAGDLVVFDSRTIHCNTPAFDLNTNVKKRPTLNENTSPRLLRIVAYVCMSPTSMVPSDQLEEFRKTREQFVRDRISCTHWPCELNISGKLALSKKKLYLFHFYRWTSIWW